MESTHMQTHTQQAMQSEQLGELAKALAAAQGQMENAKKDSKNPHFGSSYADLAAVWDACRAALSSNGLAVVQTVAAGDGGASVTVHTLLLHSSGQFIREALTLPVAQKTPHGVGSAITYGRRYSLAALVGIAQEDDDGNAGSGQQGKQQPRRDERQERPAQQQARPEAQRRQEAPAKGEEKKSAPAAAQPPQPAGPAPSEAAKEAAEKVAATAEATQRAARATALWKAAKGGGMSKDGWKTWLESVLGEAKPSSELTDDDLARLEVALPELLSGGRAA
jgi:hypothetical protein